MRIAIFISTNRNPGLYTKLLVCPIFGLPVLLFYREIREDVVSPLRKKGKS